MLELFVLRPPTRSGSFSPPGAISQGVVHLRMGTHNGRGWFPALGAASREAKLSCFLQAAMDNEIIGFQETHGTAAQVADAVKSLRNTHFIIWSSCMYSESIDFSNQEFHVPECQENSHSKSVSSKVVSHSVHSSSGGESDSDCQSTSASCCDQDHVFSSSQSSSSCNSESASVADCGYSAGGVLCTFKRSCFSGKASIVSKVWVPGRTIEITISDNDTFLRLSTSTFSAYSLTK